jgi:leader peptidase (prepilin peptidase)/N-methyltransferase
MSALDGFTLAVVAIIALVIGSFVATLALRLPAGVSLAGRSHCPHCGHVLGAADLVPLASWLVLGGRCRHCRGTIAVYYPLVELMALGIALWAATVASGWVLWASCAFGWTLLALALIDRTFFVLPDMLTMPLVPAGLAVAWFAGRPSLVDDLIGAVGGYLVFTAIAWAYRRWRGRDGLGAGDAKLLAGLGAWVGASGLPSVVLLAALLALAVTFLAWRRRGLPSLADRVPFGPFLAAAGWIVWLYGPLVG